jgi:hypothetical protein
MMLLCTELEPLTPLDADEAEWLEFLRDTSSRLSAICRNVDPASTDKALQQAASSRGEV